MKLTKFIVNRLLILLLLLAGCNPATEKTETAVNTADKTVTITREQFNADSMLLGTVTETSFEDMISCNGNISAAPDGLSVIGTSVEGKVRSVHCSLGDYVRKGQVLFTLTGHELLEIQLEYAETSAHLLRSKSEYERTKALYDERIGSEKDFLAAKSDYKSIHARHAALKMKLTELGLDVSKTEEAEFEDALYILAPINGYITRLNIVLGDYAEPQTGLAEIVDVRKLQLRLSVFERDLNKIHPGQEVQFNSMEEPGQVHRAHLISIGKSIDPETKTIPCIARIDAEQEGYINNSFIEARILFGKRKAWVLPAEAIFKTSNSYYVFVLERSDTTQYSFKMQPVEPGLTSEGFTEILTPENVGRVLIRGGYNIQQQ